MGWDAWVVVEVRGPLRQVDLFRHRFRSFWAAFCDDTRQAWMRVDYSNNDFEFAHQSASPPQGPGHYWWSSQLSSTSHTGAAEESSRRRPTLAMMAARCWAGAQPGGQQTGMAKVDWFTLEIGRIPVELWPLLIRESFSVRELAELRRWLLDKIDSLASDEYARMNDEAVGFTQIFLDELMRSLDDVISNDCIGHLIYNACLWKRTLEDEVEDMAEQLPQLAIELLAVPEVWVTDMIKVIHDRGVKHSEPMKWLRRLYDGRMDWNVDEKEDLGGVDDCNHPDGWRSFSFDVTDYDFEFEWGLNDPDPAAEDQGDVFIRDCIKISHYG